MTFYMTKFWASIHEEKKIGECCRSHWRWCRSWRRTCWTEILHITRMLYVTILVIYQFWQDQADDFILWTISHKTCLVDAILTLPIYYKNLWVITYKDHLGRFSISTQTTGSNLDHTFQQKEFLVLQKFYYNVSKMRWKSI